MMTSALALTGCAGNRLSSGILNTANDRFGVQKDIVIVKSGQESQGRRDDLSNDGQKKKGKPSDNAAQAMGAGSIALIMKDYETASATVRKPDAKPSEDDIKTYRAAGFDLSRAVCSYAFNQLGESRANYKYTTRAFSILATGGASLFGITGASGKDTSLYALIVSLLQSWSDSYEEYAYLAQSIGTLEDKVEEAQQLFRTEMERAPSPKTWSAATLQIQEYNNYCLATGMRKIVEDAVGKASLTFADHRVQVRSLSPDEILRIKETERTRVTYLSEISKIQDRLAEATSQLAAGKAKRDAADKVLSSLKPAENRAELAKLLADAKTKAAAADLDPATKAAADGEVKRLSDAASAAADADQYNDEWISTLSKQVKAAEDELNAAKEKLDALNKASSS